MKLNRLFAIALVAAAAGLFAVPSAHAVTFTFDNPGADMANLGTAFDCDGGDVCGVAPSWTNGGLTVTATVFTAPSFDSQVIQDLSPAEGGLGIVEVDDDGGDLEQVGNDNINDDEAIMLHFSAPIFLNTVSFNGDHVALGATSTYLFSADGGGAFGNRLFSATDFGGLAGQDFVFKWGGQDAEDFYIESLNADPVPEPGTLLLMGTGFLGLLGRMRKRLRG